MGIFTLPILGAIGSAIGGIFQNESREKEQKREIAYQNGQNARDERLYKQYRENDRTYSRNMTASDRRYAQQQRDNERDYARHVTVDERIYNEKQAEKLRIIDARKLRDDRNYASKKLSNQREYDSAMYNRDIARYDSDRNLMQKRADTYAEKTAASRGIDFVKMRDDAVKAGYNPMTALSMAHAYSTQIDYSAQGGVYSPGASYTTSNQGYMPLAGQGGGSAGGGGSTVAPAGAVMPSQVPAGGGFTSSGGGYQSQFEPALSAGSFIKEATDRAIDSWSNRPVERDPLADALRNAFQQDQMADQVRNSSLPQGFGYDLTKQQAFQPAATMGVPSLASGKSAVMPSGTIQEGGIDKIPVRGPNNQQLTLDKSIADRLDIKPFGKLMSEDYEALFGEMAGEPVSYYDSPIPYMGNSSLKAVRPTARQKDYSKSGITGRAMFPTGQHYNPWANY